jgi:hypothetical protein
MRIRALANGNVIHADDEAAKQLIEAGIYEEVTDDEPASPPVAPVESKPTKKRNAR